MNVYPCQKRRNEGLVITTFVVVFALVFIMALLIKQVGTGYATFRPYGVPLSIGMDGSGQVTLSAASAILPTPLGIFEFGVQGTAKLDPQDAFKGKKVLTIITGGKQRFYDMGKKVFSVKIPNDKNNQSEIRYDGYGNITVTIPDPVWANENR